MTRVLAAAGMLTLAACAASSGPRASPARNGLVVGVVAVPGEPSLRGLDVSMPGEAWASGSQGTVLRSVAGLGPVMDPETGAPRSAWREVAPEGAADLDFRDVAALSPGVAVVMSAGPGEASRLYRTEDGGASWSEVARNPLPVGFWDGIAFWDAQRGLLVGDPTGGAATVMRTSDGGRTWWRVPPEALPEAAEGEYCFAASGTSVAVARGGLAWIGTGGTRARVLRSVDAGATWTAVEVPLATGEGAGVFSVAFVDGARGVAVGGDYLDPENRSGTAAWTDDGGRTWQAASTPPGGYRSCVAWSELRQCWFAVGPNGMDASRDGGRTWTAVRHADVDLRGFHVVSARGAGFEGADGLAGADGRIAIVGVQCGVIAPPPQSRDAPITP